MHIKISTHVYYTSEFFLWKTTPHALSLPSSHPFSICSLMYMKVFIKRIFIFSELNIAYHFSAI